MTTDLATIQPRELQAVTDFSEQQIELIKRTIAVGCTDDELALFVEVCRSKRLDPFSRQIYAIKRWDSKQKREVMAIQIGIDGYRLEAERTGKYNGQGAIEWCDESGQWTDVWLSDDAPAAARCTVYREGLKTGITRVAKFSSYCARGKEGQPVANWRSMPEVMIAKCAEALALRTAFPRELGNTTIPEEMEHDHENVIHYGDSVEVEEPPPSAKLPPKTGNLEPQDIKLLKAEVSSTAKQRGLPVRESWQKMFDYATRTYGIEKWSDLNREQYNEVFDSVALELGQEPSE